MDDGAVVDCGESADLDGVEVAAEDAVVPDGDLLIEVHVADEHRAGGDPAVGGQGDHAIAQINQLPLPVGWARGRGRGRVNMREGQAPTSRVGRLGLAQGW